MIADPTLLTAATDVATANTAERFDGWLHGAEVSFFRNHVTPDTGTGEHRPPIPTCLSSLSVRRRSRLTGSRRRFAPARCSSFRLGVTHAVHNGGADTLQMISIHPAAEMITEWVDEP